MLTKSFIYSFKISQFQTNLKKKIETTNFEPFIIKSTHLIIFRINNINNSVICFFSAKCEKGIEICCLKKPQKQKRQVVNRPAGCGYRNTQGIGSRRPGAQEGETNFGEIPWMVGIFKIEVDPGTNIERSTYIVC